MKLMVIDGNSILNRAYYGIRPLTTRDGLYTHAVFGFFTTLLRLREEEQPDAVCVTFDVHAPTFRHGGRGLSKATRKPAEELRVQVPVLKEALDAMNIPRLAGRLGGRRPDRNHLPQVRGGRLGLRGGHRRQGQLQASRPRKGEAGLHPLGQTTTKDMTRSTFRGNMASTPST